MSHTVRANMVSGFGLEQWLEDQGWSPTDYRFGDVEWDGDCLMAITIHFSDAKKALLFKLTWGGAR